jgi:hypothetical protein
MTTYNETTSGGLKISGCFLVKIIRSLQTLYGPGDIVYNIHKARKGTLEKVVIKEQKAIKNKKTMGKFLFMYTDTFNGLWNEWDLIRLPLAKSLAEDYLLNLLTEVEKLDKC